MVWSGSRTRDRQIKNLLLYPSELSSGGRTGFEPAPTAFAAARPLSFRPLAKHLLPRFGIRHGKAARTGRVRSVKAGTRTAGTWSFDVPYCRLPPTGNACRRIAPCPFRQSIRAARVEASQRGAHAPAAAAPLLRRVIRHAGCFGAETCSVRLDWPNSFDAYASLANAKNKTPPGLATRGRSRVASGDRGGRSPREFSRSRCPGTGCVRRAGRTAAHAHPRRGVATGQTGWR